MIYESCFLLVDRQEAAFSLLFTELLLFAGE
jgi:hypothetical protein